MAYLRCRIVTSPVRSRARLAGTPLSDTGEGRPPRNRGAPRLQPWEFTRRGITGERCLSRLKVRFETDSPLEEAGFEPSVPRDTTKFSTPAHVTYAWFPARGKVGANENRHHEDARRLPRNRWFESCSLQR
jgi:hypothetical protein